MNKVEKISQICDEMLEFSRTAGTVVNDEIEVCKSRIQPHDTGHLYTAISVMESRLDELDPYSG